jgi:hypothetical protein
MKSFMVLCVDHRMYEDELADCIPQGPYVLSFVGGAVGALKYFETLADEIKSLEDIKGPFDEIIIHDHMNCAAHGGSETKEDHVKVMTELETKIANHFPHLKIKKSLVDIESKKVEEHS